MLRFSAFFPVWEGSYHRTFASLGKNTQICPDLPRFGLNRLQIWVLGGESRRRGRLSLRLFIVGFSHFGFVWVGELGHIYIVQGTNDILKCPLAMTFHYTD